MFRESLQDRIDAAGGVANWIDDCPTRLSVGFAYPAEHSNWRDEQRAWAETAVLFDQSFHMVDLYIKGPDTMRLLSETAVNSFADFGRNKAKQYLAVNSDGYVIADAVLFGLEDDLVSVVGTPVAPDWLMYQAEKGGYDVTFTYDSSQPFEPGPRQFYRYELEGPNAWKILEKAHGGPLDHIGFFRMGEFTIGRHLVRALNHTMGGVPGQESTGLEIFGPFQDGPAVVEALLEAGEEFGLVRGGSTAYLSALTESGWIPNPIPAIYGDDLKEFREQVAAGGVVYDFLRPQGSFRSQNVSDYYSTPWDLGYGHMVRFDHEFIGRAALEQMAGDDSVTGRRKAWVVWNRDDVAALLADATYGGDDRPLPLVAPCPPGSYDAILLGDEQVGVTYTQGYTVNLNEWSSMATVDSRAVDEGTEVEILWGKPSEGEKDPAIGRYKQRRVRATVHYNSPALG